VKRYEEPEQVRPVLEAAGSTIDVAREDRVLEPRLGLAQGTFAFVAQQPDLDPILFPPIWAPWVAQVASTARAPHPSEHERGDDVALAEIAVFMTKRAKRHGSKKIPLSRSATPVPTISPAATTNG